MIVKIRKRESRSYYFKGEVTTILASKAGVIGVDWIDERKDYIAITTDKRLKVIRECNGMIRLVAKK